MNALAGLLAHQGGWDEVLLPIVAVLLVIGLGVRRRRSAEDDDAETSEASATEPGRPAVCQYCGADLKPEDERCPKCGFARD